MPRPIRIVILTADYGSRHRSAAHALEVGLARVYGDAVRVEVRNPIHHASAPALLRIALRRRDPVRRLSGSAGKSSS